MNNTHTAAKITLTIHHGLYEKALEILTDIGLRSVLVESARCVRQNVIDKSWWYFGKLTKLIDVPTEIFRFTVPESLQERITSYLIKELELKTPGRGSVFAQLLTETSDSENDYGNIKVGTVSEQILTDLTLITGIQSKLRSGSSMYKVALKLGAGVPVVGMGIGTGIRDRLGLLRITISPEKEFTYLIVPSHDAVGLQNLLIDEGHLNRPGGGFVYQTPISAGMVDPLIRIGHQEHAASFEQIIAAIDDLKQSTEWRKRFFGLNDNAHASKNSFTYKELSLLCPEDNSDLYIQAAMNAGANGATTVQVRKIELQGENAGNSVNSEIAIMCIASENEEKITKAIKDSASQNNERSLILQSIQASSAFHRKRK